MGFSVATARILAHAKTREAARESDNACSPMTANSPQHPLRAEPRVVAKVQLSVSTGAWDGFIKLVTKDVSCGGAFFLYSQRLVPTSGTPCAVQLGASTVPGVVAHVMTARLATATGCDAGFGVAFSARQHAEWWLTPRATEPPAPPPPAQRAPPTPKELESAANFRSLGMSLYERGEYAAARQKFELADRLVGARTDEALAAVCVAQIYARSGEPVKARDSIERALQLDPSCVLAASALASLGRRR
jgi:hypothetical protein